MGLWGVVLGGVLAIAGGMLGQWWAARERRREANRERLERYRQDVTRALVEADEVINRAAPAVLTLFGSHETIRDKLLDLYERDRESGRLLLAASVGRPGPDADPVADALEQLRRDLAETVGRSGNAATALMENTSSRGDFTEAEAANTRARAQLDSAREALRDL